MVKKTPQDEITMTKDETPQLVRKRRVVTEREKMEKAKKGCADTDAPSSARVMEMDTSREKPQVYVRKSPSKHKSSPIKEVEEVVQIEEVLVIDD